MELGKKIRQLRFKAGLTQEQLAEKLGIAPQSVSKWENAVAMPDITALPLIAEVFGVSIDDLFDLTAEQRFNRIENRMDMEEELPPDVFLEYEEFLKTRLADPRHKKRSAELMAYLYWHRMNSYARKASCSAREAIRMAPGEKVCQWMLADAEKHAVWDWNIANHAKAVDFYRELAEANPETRLPYLYLLDNLIADHRTEEAERYLARLRALPDTNPIMNEVYRAHIALARFDEPGADAIMEALGEKYADEPAYLVSSEVTFDPPGRPPCHRGDPGDHGGIPESRGHLGQDRGPAGERMGHDGGDRAPGRQKRTGPSAGQSVRRTRFSVRMNDTKRG